MCHTGKRQKLDHQARRHPAETSAETAEGNSAEVMYVDAFCHEQPSSYAETLTRIGMEEATSLPASVAPTAAAAPQLVETKQANKEADSLAAYAWDRYATS